MLSLLRFFTVSLLMSAMSPQANADLRLYHIDVNQGDSTLIVGPTGKSLLIDTGEDGYGDEICDTAAEAGVTQIDILVTTHYHKDHYGSADEIADCGLTVVAAYDRGNKGSKSGEVFDEYQGAFGNTALPVVPGQIIPFEPDVEVKVVAANGLLEGENGSPTSAENDNSVALLISYNGFTAFYGGDMEVHTENKIVTNSTVTNVSLYQANHHGVDNGSSRGFLDALKPKVIIISNGDHAGHAHPRKSALLRMQATVPAPVIFQTNKFTKDYPTCRNCDKAGNVPDEFIADLEPSGSTNPILVTVNHSGKFQVQLDPNRMFGQY